MGQELQIPEVFQGKTMAKAFQGHVNPQDDNLADGIGASYPIVYYKGKNWTIRHRGERKLVVRPDDGTASGHLDVIILGQAKAKSKSFYKKWDPNNEGERPICASIDGIVPDPDVTVKQSDTCALCPRNVWKTNAENGRRERECTDYKRLAVLAMPTQTKAIFGEPLMEPMFLRVPPDSLNNLAIMGDTMTSQGFHYSTYLTRISFDPQKAHPCLVFRPLQPLNDQEAEVVIELRKNPIIERITGGDVSSQGIRAVGQMAPAGSTATGLGAPATATHTSGKSATQRTLPQNGQQTETDTTPTAESSSGLGLVPATSNSKAAAQPAIPKRTTSKSARAPSSSTASENTAQSTFGGVNGASASPPLSDESSGSMEGDASANETTDDDLDMEIAKLIKKK